MIASLAEALEWAGIRSAAIVGAGGKTSALFRWARALPGPVFLANSAHLGVEQALLADLSFQVGRSGELPDFPEGAPGQILLFHGPELIGRRRLGGLASETLALLNERARSRGVPLLIEADGARGLPLKAPAEHEPPIPEFVEGVLVCAGLSGLGKPLDEACVFRPELFGVLSGLGPGQWVDEEALARVLCASQGGLKRIPSGARRIALLNQADTPDLRQRALRLAGLLLAQFDGVVIASLRGAGPEPPAEIHAVRRPTAGIVLAAGGSRRMGRPKQLLDWQGEPLVRRAARAALEGGLDPVVVVVGAGAEEVSAALAGLRVAISLCENWPEGQSASLKAGLREALRLRPSLGGAVFLLCDQPYVDGKLVRAVADLRDRSLDPACAPFVSGRRANPVLFGSETFPLLLALEGDQGGRQILERTGLEQLEWDDTRILEDIDTLEDYRRLAGGM